jgi:photosystem II stability/assembly factor-like uncharacterized protein
MQDENDIRDPAHALDNSRAMKQHIRLYCGTAGHSAWFSDDRGESWVHPNSHSGLYLEARVWAFSSHPAVPEHVYAGTDEGVYRWDEPSARWTLLESPMRDVWAIAQDPKDPARVFAGSRPGALFFSGDAGASWRKLDVPGVAQFSDVNRGPTRVTQILFEGETLWATIEIGGIYRSGDRGASWKMVDRGLISADVHGLAVLGRGLVLATTNRGLHRSEDDGEHWTWQKLDSPWQYTRAIVPSADGRTIFLCNGDGPPGTTGRLLRSTDAGRSWQACALPGRLNSTPWCVAVHPADPRLVFACTNLGQLFRSEDGGETWRRLEHEFGEVRALHWRALPAELPRGEFTLTKRTVPA